jgi:hypothetical protein
MLNPLIATKRWSTFAPTRASLTRLGLLMALSGGMLNGMQISHPGNINGPLGGISGANSDGDHAEQEKRLKAINAERQKSLVADTNKLVKLATELNRELNSAKPESLSADQMRKVAEIEKLAKNVREKMSMSVRGLPVFEPLPGRLN